MAPGCPFSGIAPADVLERAGRQTLSYKSIEIVTKFIYSAWDRTFLSGILRKCKSG